MGISAAWLGSAVLFFLFHRFGLQVTLIVLGCLLVVAIAAKYGILPLGPLEEWYDDFCRRRQAARLSRQARQEQIAADPINNEILYLQQFASPALMLMLTPEEFLELVIRYFRLLGYARRYQRVERGGPSDAILRKDKDWYLLRCLRVKDGLVDESAVRALAGVMDENLCLCGILVTNEGFTPDCEKVAEELKITLLDGQMLAGSMMAFQIRDPTLPRPVRPKRKPQA